MNLLREYIREMLVERRFGKPVWGDYLSPPQDLKDKTGIDLVYSYRLPPEFGSSEALQSYIEENEPEEPVPAVPFFTSLVDSLVELNPELAPIVGVGKPEEWMLLPDQEISDLYPEHLRDIAMGVASDFSPEDIKHYIKGAQTPESDQIIDRIEAETGVRPQWLISPETAAKHLDLHEQMIREYVRTLFTEAAKGLAELGDMTVYVKHGGGGIEVWVIDPTRVPPETDKFRLHRMNQRAIGLISATQERGECLDGYVVTWAHVDDEHKGWGPMLYDTAMELATQAGSGLLSDRNNVSYEASKVWQYYAGSRGDVEAVQLDDFDGHLTPEIEEDDCADLIVYSGRGIESGDFWDGDLNDDGEEETPWDPYGKDILLQSPLSKLYKSTGTPTLDMLRSAGKLVEL